MRIAVLGAGAGGAAAAVQLIQSGHEVSIWTRSSATIAPYREAGRISFDGALGEGEVVPRLMSSDLRAVLDHADGAVVVLPAIAHEDVARALASSAPSMPIVLNPGGTGGALLFRNVFLKAGASLPPLAELSTLTYIARKTGPARVSIYSVAGVVHGASLPEADDALDLADMLFDGIGRERNVLSTSLRNINLVLHPPAALLSAAWVEATEGDFYFYADAMTPGVFRVMEAFDQERRAVGRALSFDLPPIVEEMMKVGSVDAESFDRGDFRESIAHGRANASIKAPESLEHRYYREDLGCAVLPFSELARICDVETPVADAILTLGTSALTHDIRSFGFTADRLGIRGLDRTGLLATVGEETL